MNRDGWIYLAFFAAGCVAFGVFGYTKGMSQGFDTCQIVNDSMHVGSI